MTNVKGLREIQERQKIAVDTGHPDLHSLIEKDIPALLEVIRLYKRTAEHVVPLLARMEILLDTTKEHHDLGSVHELPEVDRIVTLLRQSPWSGSDEPADGVLQLPDDSPSALRAEIERLSDRDDIKAILANTQETVVELRAEVDRLFRALKLSEAERERLMDLRWPPTEDRLRGLAGVAVEKWTEKPYRRYSFDQAIGALAAALSEDAVKSTAEKTP